MKIERQYERTLARILASEEDMPEDDPFAYFTVLLAEAVGERIQVNPFMDVRRNV